MAFIDPQELQELMMEEENLNVGRLLTQFHPLLDEDGIHQFDF